MKMVTAVITTHKREPEIVERAIKSVLAQTHQNIELIVVDDSPADYEYRDQVRKAAQKNGAAYIPHETCQGACVARNTGLSIAKGEYIAFLDDDDEWKPEKIEKQLTAFTDTNIALVYCGRETKNDTTDEVILQDVEFVKGRVFDKLITVNYIGSTSFPLMRTTCLREIGGFDPQMKSAQDYDVWLRLAEKYEVSFVEDSLVIYHVHSGEQISKNYMRRVSGLERLNKKNAAYLKKHRKACWIRTIKLAPEYAGNKQYGKAFGVWMKSVLLQPFNIVENMRWLYRTLRNVKAGLDKAGWERMCHK